MALRSSWNTAKTALQQYAMDNEDKTPYGAWRASVPASNNYGVQLSSEASAAATASYTHIKGVGDDSWQGDGSMKLMWNFFDEIKRKFGETMCFNTKLFGSREQLGQKTEITNNITESGESAIKMGEDGRNCETPRENLPGTCVDNQNENINSSWFNILTRQGEQKTQAKARSDELNLKFVKETAKWRSGSDGLDWERSAHENLIFNCEDLMDVSCAGEGFVKVHCYGVGGDHGGDDGRGKGQVTTTRKQNQQHDQEHEESQLLEAASEGDLERLDHLLQEGVDVTVASPTGECKGWRALHRAAEKGHVEAVRKLLKAEERVAENGAQGCSSIVRLGAQLAAQGGHLEVVKELLPIMTRDDLFAYTPETCSVHDPPPGNQLIHLAALGGHVEVIQYLCNEGFDASAVTNDGKKKTALHLACENLNEEAAMYLAVSARCALTLKDCQGSEASDVAAENGNKHLAQYLIKVQEIFSAGQSDIKVAEEAVEQTQTGHKRKHKNRRRKRSNQKQRNQPKETLPRGLRNLGNTCYLNSIVQCLFHTNTLTNFFLDENWRTHKTINRSAGEHHGSNRSFEYTGSHSVEHYGYATMDEVHGGTMDEVHGGGKVDGGHGSGSVDEGLGGGSKDEGDGSGRVDDGHGSGRVDDGHGSGRVDDGHGSGRVDDGHGSDSVDDGHGSGSVDDGHGSGSDGEDDVSNRGGVNERHGRGSGTDSDDYGDSCNITYHGEVAERFCALVVALKRRENPEQPLRHFKNTIGRYDSTFAGTSQEDAFDILSFLLDAMDRDLQGRGRSLPAEMFTGLHLSTIKCMTTGVLISEVEETFTCLSLPVTKSGSRRGQNLTECLERYYMKHMLLWDCPKCLTTHDCQNAVVIKKLPRVLAIHLSRVVASPYESIKERVTFPRTLTEINRYSVSEQRLQYELYAACHHYGTISRGHYTATCRAGEGGDTWHYFDDNHVTPKSNGPETEGVHILFYECSEL